jgi:two-component system OmpR family sensor kinase
MMIAGTATAETAPSHPLGRVRRSFARMPLRVKLVATLLLLVIGALVGSGVAATTTLRGYLVDRVDAQLQSVGTHTLDHGGPGDASGHDSTPGEADGGGLPSAFVTEVTNVSGQVVYGPTNNLIDSSIPLPVLPHRTGAQTASIGAATFTVSAVEGDSQWRVRAMPVTLTNGGPGTLFVAQSLADVQSTVSRLSTLLLVIGAVSVVVLAGVGYLVVRASLRPLRQVEHTAAQIAAGDLSQRVTEADPHTEVGQLSSALNSMLSQIEHSFAMRAASEEAARHSEEKMRQFVADASHELRTPLTSIRGFAELYRQGAAASAEDIPRLMQRIENEAKRMGVLVEDLLLLARLDQQRPLEQSPVDMLAVTHDAVVAARAIDPGRHISFTAGITDPPPVVTGDSTRLRQVLDNLLSNALRHTPSGTTVEVRVDSRNSGGGAIVAVEVADQGPGMAEEHAARAFERFYRADPSRNRAGGGAGLGLAIVAALVAGHSGTVRVDTAPGDGARFTVELPLMQPAVLDR